LTIPDTTSGIFVVYLHHMRTLLFFVLLLIGLVGYSQTNTHQRITGQIYTRGLNFIPSNNDIQILLYEVDSFGVARQSILSNYTVGIQGNQYFINFILTPTQPVVVYVKLLPGSRLYGKFLSTFGQSSLSVRHSTKVVVPYTPPSVPSSITHDIYMIPDISWRANSRFID